MNARRAIGVSIVTYGNAETIERCVAGAWSIDGVAEVVVVDHGQDGSGCLAQEAGARVIFDPGNPGFGAGQNRALRHLDTPYVLLLNPDAEPVAEGIVAGVRLLDARPDVAMVQGVILDAETGHADRSQGRELSAIDLFGRAVGAKRLLRLRPFRSLARALGVGDHLDRSPASPTEVDSLAATAVLARADALREIGGFDERYFLYGEDLDLCRRLRARGWRLVALADLWSFHRNGLSSNGWVNREMRWWNGTLRFRLIVLKLQYLRFETITSPAKSVTPQAHHAAASGAKP